nr:immunoglobulin heavy chain junction region [Macaca mulatta]MOW25635.1 immunoglobulin heavy chain junction region [Macaca mulatta]MOW26164.1 immunoglobulin heavy chain junction region [Macaca mulatta]
CTRARGGWIQWVQSYFDYW